MVFPYKNLTGAQIMFKIFNQKKVTNIFTYTGGPIMAAVDQLHKSNNNKIKHYINTHEQSAGHSATAYARLSGKPGICLMTSGPGVTNMVTPLADATNDSTPLILFTGNVPLKSIGTNAFQECPATEITAPITKWSYLIKDVHEVPDILEWAFHIATTGKPGSVHIDIPKCILNTKYLQDKTSRIIYGNDTRLSSVNINKFQNTNTLEIINLLNKAQKPLIIAGQGCNNYSLQLKSFALRGNIPVTTTIHALGVFDESHELSLEFLGMHGHPAANYSVQEADLIIALGTRFDDRTTGEIKKYAPNAFKAFERNEGGIVHVNINSGEFNNVINSHFNFDMDCGKFLSSITPFYRERVQWMEQIRKWKRNHPFTYNKSKNLKTQEVISEINKYLKNTNNDNYVITTGVGNHQMMTCQFIKWKYPKSLISSGSLGVMGVGLPFAIGAQIADPSKLVIDIDGDGSFNHSLSELKTVMNHNLPIKIAIMNDTCFSMVNTWEKLFFEERYTATNLIKNPNYRKIANAYGIKSLYCNKRQDLNTRIRQFLSYDKAILCEFKVESDQCYPLVMPGSGLDEMILSTGTAM